MKNVAVFFGGQSIEHEISCITGVLTVNSVDASRYNAIPIYVSQEGKWWTGEILKDVDFYKNPNEKKLTRVTMFAGDNKLYKLKANKYKPLYDLACVINCVHGERGEDGSLAGFINLCNVAFASPPIGASAISMSKELTKIALKGLRIKVLDYLVVNKREDANLIEKRLSFPVIVKPDTGGSSIGIKTATDKRNLEHALAYALRYSEKAIIEPLVEDFIEINCACYKYGDKLIVSECEKPVSRGQILSFSDKYEKGTRVFPADIDNKLSDKIKKTTQTVYQALGFEGVIRVDYIVKDNQVYLNEINSVPGSLSYYLFVKTLKEFGQMLNNLVDQSLNENARRSTLVKKFSSGILGAHGSKGAKRLKK